MSQDCSISGRGLRAGRLLRPLAPAALAVALAGVLGVSISAQFPPPARPPKVPDAAAKAPAKDAALPAARVVLDRYVAAIGGRQAILGHRSTHVRGSVRMPAAGITGTVEIFGAAPNKSLLKISLAGVGDVVEGFDGQHGWSISPMTGPMLLEGKQLDDKRFDADFHSELRSDARYASITTMERSDFEGRPCYKIRLVRKGGSEDIEYYDVETGLKAGSVTTRETQMGTITGTTVETDYKKFGNLLQPTRVRSTVGPVEQIVTIESVEYDGVAASVFEMPAGIKALLK